MLNIWPVLFDLSWILAIQGQALHNVLIFLVPMGIYLLFRFSPVGIWPRVIVIPLLAIAIIWGGFGSAIVAVITLLLAYLRRHLPDQHRYAYMAGVVAWVVLTLTHPASAYFPLILVLMTIGGLLIEAWQKNKDMTLALITGLATFGSLFVALILWVVPWGFLLTHTLGLAGGVLVSGLLRVMPKLKPGARKNTSATSRGLHVLREHGKTHSFVGTDILIITAALALFILILWLILRKKRLDIPEELGQSQNVAVHLETITLPTEPVWKRMGLSPVRAFVMYRLKRAQKGGSGKVLGQTFRQWMLTRAPDNPHVSEIARIYEEVRYGGAEDTSHKAQKLKRLWKDQSS